MVAVYVVGAEVRCPADEVNLDFDGVAVSGVVGFGAVVTVGRLTAMAVEADESDVAGFAEYVAAREDQLAHKPACLTFEPAAVVPVAGLTALHALRAGGRVKAGDRVLIIGASGGVGSYATQLAKAMGAEVTGVASPPRSISSGR